MENIIIQKEAMKFTVEVTSRNGELEFNVVRYIDVARDESIDTNAKLAKNDALCIDGHFVNCNMIVKNAIKGMEGTMLPYALSMNKTCKIRLKKSFTFGY